MTAFANEPALDLRDATVRDGLLEALKRLDARLPLEVPAIVDRDARRDALLTSVDPCDPTRIVAQSACATTADVDAAVTAAARSQPGWGATQVEDRVVVLRRAAAELRRRRYELAALQVRECGKPWDQADGDVCEAIDLIEYYARQAVQLERADNLPQSAGERNTMLHRPRGVVAVIAPWNFPIAIATGMSAAALVTGNAVCLKPAEQSPACAHAMVEIFHTAGVPAGALALLPGSGEVGATLVAHPGVHTIAFTGSDAIGVQIIARAATPTPGQRHLMQVVAEMGGKNCVIVDHDADLDDAVPALLESAFAFAGQKCSAASRVLVHERIADELTRRLEQALDTLVVGFAEDFNTDVPPVIDAASRDRIEHALTQPGYGAVLRRASTMPAGDGFWVAPTLATQAPDDSPIVTTELFGPVLSIEIVPSMASACDIVDAQRQALTGGLFSNSPQTIAEVIRRSPVGNLYINRGTTGAVVGRQPFGGNRLSGTGARTGGPEYLRSFTEQLVVTERLS